MISEIMPLSRKKIAFAVFLLIKVVSIKSHNPERGQKALILQNKVGSKQNTREMSDVESIPISAFSDGKGREKFSSVDIILLSYGLIGILTLQLYFIYGKCCHQNADNEKQKL